MHISHRPLRVSVILTISFLSSFWVKETVAQSVNSSVLFTNVQTFTANYTGVISRTDGGCQEYYVYAIRHKGAYVLTLAVDTTATVYAVNASGADEYFSAVSEEFVGGVNQLFIQNWLTLRKKEVIVSNLRLHHYYRPTAEGKKLLGGLMLLSFPKGSIEDAFFLIKPIKKKIDEQKKKAKAKLPKKPEVPKPPKAPKVSDMLPK